MIQFKRGLTSNWRKLKKPLEAGQPGYDKNKHKIKIGDGEHLWSELPYASGLSYEEILSSEADAKIKNNKDSEDKAIITYGEDTPTNSTTGQIYLQYYDTEPETDYIVGYGIDGIWTYQKWHSGIAKCWGTLSLTAGLHSAFEGTTFYSDSNVMKEVSYPITFKNIPCEVATLNSPGGIVWLANRKANTVSKTGLYSIISPDYLANNTTYRINLSVEGTWK